MLSLPKASTRSPLLKLLVVVFVLAIAAASAIPYYVSGNWALQKVPSLSSRQLQPFKELRQQGLELPGWHTLDQQVIEIGGHSWSVQAIVPKAEAATATPEMSTLLMLRPQTGQRDMPEVDWMDINGAQGWTIDSQQHLQFTVQPSSLLESQLENQQPIHVEANFFRGWTSRRTYAVLQWYAWSTGGHFAPSRWFWTEQGTQFRDRRHLPWIAVSLLIPIAPLDDIAPIRSPAEAIAQLIQSNLLQTTLHPIP